MHILVNAGKETRKTFRWVSPLKFSVNLARSFSPHSLDDVTMQSRANLPHRLYPICSPMTTKRNITVAFSRGNLQDSTGRGRDEN